MPAPSHSTAPPGANWEISTSLVPPHRRVTFLPLLALSLCTNPLLPRLPPSSVQLIFNSPKPKSSRSVPGTCTAPPLHRPQPLPSYFGSRYFVYPPHRPLQGSHSVYIHIQPHSTAKKKPDSGGTCWVSIVPSLETSRTASVGSFKILDIYLDLKSLVSKLGFRAVPANRGRSCFCLSLFSSSCFALRIRSPPDRAPRQTGPWSASCVSVARVPFFNWAQEQPQASPAFPLQQPWPSRVPPYSYYSCAVTGADRTQTTYLPGT